MSVLASKCKSLDTDKKFNKELFTEVSQNLKVFTDAEWVTDRDTLAYKKVLIAVYVRTDKENLVLMIDRDKFASVSNVPDFIVDSGIYSNTLIDAGLICAKSLIDRAFKFKSEEAMKRLVMKSACYPVGAVETLKKYALVFNVIIAEDLLRDSDISLNEGFRFYPIESLYMTDSLQREISESLVIVKSEDKK